MLVSINQAGLHFVKMTEEMLPDILAIEHQSYPVGWSTQLFKDCIRNQYNSRVLTQDDVIVGYYVVQQILDEYHVLNLCVAPGYTHNGLGKYQLDHIITKARAKRMNRILLEVRNSGKIARKLYRNAGFEIVGKRKSYYPTSNRDMPEREDAFLMELALF